MRMRLRGLGVWIGGLGWLVGGVAGAQEASREGAALSLEERVRTLEAEIETLKARGGDTEADPEQTGSSPVSLHGQLHHLFLFRSDTDFDRRAPLYNENGQTSGAFATVFGPTLEWRVTKDVRVFYEAEVGLNYWSKNNPDQENALAADIFVLKHRQILTEGVLAGGRVGFKVGYQYYTDTTGLFLGHWIGVAEVDGRWAPGQRAGVFVGMVPDTTYEGVDVRFNNFRRDIFVFGGRTDLALGDWQVNAGVHVLYDTHIVRRTRWLVAPNLHVEGKTGWLAGGAVRLSGALDAVFQGGRSENSALDGADQTLLAWAAQGRLTIETKPVVLRLNVLALSPDDAHLGNHRDGAFCYSSKSTSSTLFFTEDEVRNWYDQLDRRLAYYEGGFWRHRAGLLVADLKVTATLWSWFQPSVILGYGMVLEPRNALGGRNLGVEADLDLTFRLAEPLWARVVVGGMFPGKAAGAMRNEIAPQERATDAIGWTEAALSVVF